MAQMVKTTCRKCNETFTLNIGENTLDEAIEMLKQTKGFECTAGHHIELGSPMDYWTIHPETIYEAQPMTDQDWLERLKATVESGKVWDTQELARDYEISGFSAGLCIAKDRTTREEVCFDHGASPSGKRYYWRIC